MKANRLLSNRYFSGQVARHYYRRGDIVNFLKYIKDSEITYRNIGMLFTIAIPPLRKWVLKHFNVSGRN